MRCDEREDAGDEAHVLGRYGTSLGRRPAGRLVKPHCVPGRRMTLRRSESVT